MPQTTQTYLAIGMRMERKAARYSASPIGGSSASGHPDLPGNRHEDGKRLPGTQRLPWEGPVPQTPQTYLAIGMRMERKVVMYSESHIEGSSPPDHPDLPGNRHEDGAKGGQVLSVSWEGPVPQTTQSYLAMGIRMELNAAMYSASPMGGPVHRTTQYLAMGMRMEQKAARYLASPMGGSSATDHPDLPGNRHIGMRMERKAVGYTVSPMGGSRAPDHPDLPGNGHENRAKGGQVLSVSHGRDPCAQPPTDPDLPGDRPEDGAKGGQVLNVFHERDPSTRTTN